MKEEMPDLAEKPVESLQGRAAAGVFWLTVQKWAIRLSGFVTIAVLTRQLSAEDFGTVAAASAVLPFFYLLSDVGFAAYIVQAETVNRRMLSTAFWFSTLAGLVLSGALFLLAPAVGLVFRSDDVVPVMQVMALAVILTGIASVPMALLRRAMRFRALAVQGTVAALVAQVIAIAMALSGFGVWALVGQALGSQLVVAVLALISARWRPAFTFSTVQFGLMARFGIKVLGVEFVTVSRIWAEAAIISATLGMAALGYLSIAQRLVQIVQDMSGAAIVPVSTVAFAKLRATGDRLRGAYIRALRATYALMSLPLIWVAIAAPLIIPVVFGDGWSGSTTVAQILALAGILVVGASLDHGLFYGLGRPGLWLLYAVVIDALTVGVTLVTAPWGLEAVAYGFLAVAAIATVIRWVLVSRLVDASFGMLAAPFGLLLLAVAAGAGAGWGALALSSGLTPLSQIIIVGVFVCVAYVAVVALCARTLLREMTGHLSRFARRRDVPRDSTSFVSTTPDLPPIVTTPKERS